MSYQPPTQHLLQFFTWDHLPEKLQEISKQYAHLAYTTVSTCGEGPETTVALRKLLEAKDAAVRARLILGGKTP